MAVYVGERLHINDVVVQTVANVLELIPNYVAIKLSTFLKI